ncbi:hypothetical protein, partial [Streptomyces sp. NPDC007346]|uniref:hypothetical protein n=1 Tax=Streptomyces sp. NPDC007346 TaxID=3154682 RepID=UPI00345301F3
MPQIPAEKQAAANVAPARCGKGKAIHYATNTGRPEVALLCGYQSFGGAHLLADADLTKMGAECTRCIKNVQRMLERATPAEAPAPAAPAPAEEAQPVRHLADYNHIRTAEGPTVHRITVTRTDETEPLFTTDLPYDEARNAARTLETLGWTITGMETYGGPSLFRAWVEPTPIAEVLAESPLPFHGPDFWVGLHALCGYDDHTAPLDAPGLLAPHPRRRGIMGSCPGSLRPARTHRDQPTSQHTTAVSYTGPKPCALAYWSMSGDILHVDGQDLTVEDCRPDERHPSRVNVLVTGAADPLVYSVEDLATYRRRVRRHNVECQACGVYAAVVADEAVDGTPSVRLCGMCDRETAEAPAAPQLTPDQARTIVTRSYPGAHDFRHSHDAALRFLGYTFQVSEDAPVRFGWITPAGTHSRVGEPTRASAHQLLPTMVLEDNRAATRTAADVVPAQLFEQGAGHQHALGILFGAAGDLPGA